MSEDSSLDMERLEERWSNVNEDFLDQISIDCYNECEHHQIRALWLKRLYFVLSIVNIILPSLQLTNFIPLTTQKYLTFIIPITVGFNAWLNPAGTGETHNNFANKYRNLNMKIRKQLIRGKRFRIAFDVFLESISQNYSHLQDIAPKI